MLYEDLTEKIIKAAMTVHNILGFGCMGKVYENSLMIELELSDLKAIQQQPMKVFYKEKLVGDYIADVIVEDKIIVELKSIENLNKIHEVQLVNYLKAVNMEVGLLLNFGKEKLEFKRKVLNL
jgi:GxxExxY protein